MGAHGGDADAGAAVFDHGGGPGDGLLREKLSGEGAAGDAEEFAAIEGIGHGESPRRFGCWASSQLLDLGILLAGIRTDEVQFTHLEC